MARLVIGTGDETQDLFMHARTMLREGDAPPGVAAAFAGAILERHLRELVEARTGSAVEDRRAKLGRFAAELKRIEVFTASEVQLVSRIEGFRDTGPTAGTTGSLHRTQHGRSERPVTWHVTTRLWSLGTPKLPQPQGEGFVLQYLSAQESS